MDQTPSQVLPRRGRGRPRNPDREAGKRAQKDYLKVPDSVLVRERIGQRAHDRRREIRISLAAVGDAVGVSQVTVCKWERELPKRLTLERARRWERALMVPEGWLVDVESEAPALASTGFPQTRTVAEEILAVASWLARPRFRERTFLFDGLRLDEKRLATIFSMRFGVSFDKQAGKRTLKSVGDEFSLTRERIRQVVAKMIERAHQLGPIKFPALDQLPGLIQTRLPATDGALDSDLSEILGDVSVANADRFSREVLGRSVLPSQSTKHGLHLADEETAGLAVAVQDVANRMMRGMGAGQIHMLYGLACQSSGKSGTIDEIKRIAASLPQFEWLDEANGWFWTGPGDTYNRVTATAMKILSATGGKRVDAEEIMAGLSRRWRERDEDNSIFYSVLPTVQVVKAILKRQPWIRTVQHDDFELKEIVPLDWFLSESERAILKSIQQNGGVASRRALTKALVGDGSITNVGLSVTLSNSPIVRQVGPALYAIRGVEFDGAAVKKALLDDWHGRVAAKVGKDGWVTCKIRLNKSICQNRIFSVPAALAGRLQPGSYVLEGSSSEVNLVVLPDRGMRFNLLAKAIIDAGLSEKDAIRLSVHPERRHVRFEKA